MRLEDRLRQLASGVERPDWPDVLRRSEAHAPRRRRTVLVIAFVALWAVAVPTALALRSTVVDFFAGEPAPNRVEEDFARLDVGAPPNMSPRVIPEQTRKVFETTAPGGGRLVLWVAPTRKGGFCTQLEELKPNGTSGGGGGGGCSSRDAPFELAPSLSIAGPITPQGVIRGGPVIVSGQVTIAAAESVEVRFTDGTSTSVRVVWVSEPIDTGFFVYPVPSDRWNEGRPTSLAARSATGEVLAEQPVPFELPRLTNPDDPNAPADAILARRRKLIEIETHKGIDAVLWTAPSRVDGRCHWLAYGAGGFGGGCVHPNLALHPLALGQSQGSGVVLLWGGPLRADVMTVEVEYEDGDSVRLHPTDGMILYEIPPSHFEQGHRVNLIIARDARGAVVAQRRQRTDVPGSYPCKKPEPLGHGVSACP
jgi:hypothetical protein